MKFERFTDGVAKIYAVANIADAGDRPVDGLKLKYRLCYQYKTVGVKRFSFTYSHNLVPGKATADANILISITLFLICSREYNDFSSVSFCRPVR